MTWRYIAADLRTGAIYGALPLRDVSFTRLLNGAGAMRAKLDLPVGRDAESKALAALYVEATEETKTCIYVERNGKVFSGYPIWVTDYDTDTRTIDLLGAEMWSYWRRRRIRWDKEYVNTDQLKIARGLIRRAQLPTAGNLGFTFDNTTSGQPVTIAYRTFEDKPVGEAVEQLAKAEDGFDFAADVIKVVGEGYGRRFRTYYPRKGRTAAQSGLVFTYGVNALKIQVPRNGTGSANSWVAYGAGEGPRMLRGVAVDSTALADGYPLLEDSSAYKDALQQDQIDRYARGDLDAAKRPITLPKAKVLPDLPDLSTYDVGDEARLIIPAGKDPYWPTGLDLIARINAVTIGSPDDGQVETADLTFEEVAT